MKASLLTLASVLAGSLLTFLVAWAATIVESPPPLSGAQHWDGPVPAQWPRQNLALRVGRGFAITTLSISDMRLEEGPEPGTMLVMANFSQEVLQAGWPMRALQCGLTDGVPTAIAPIAPAQLRGQARRMGLPVRPLRAGIVVDSAIFGACVAAVRSIGPLRRVRRKSRNLCPRCGYPVPSATGKCPECGHA